MSGRRKARCHLKEWIPPRMMDNATCSVLWSCASIGALAKAAETSAATSFTESAAALLHDSNILSPPLGGPLQDSIARCLEAAGALHDHRANSLNDLSD